MNVPLSRNVTLARLAPLLECPPDEDLLTGPGEIVQLHSGKHRGVDCENGVDQVAAQSYSPAELVNIGVLDHLARRPSATNPRRGIDQRQADIDSGNIRQSFHSCISNGLANAGHQPEPGFLAFGCMPLFGPPMSRGIA